MTPMDKLNKLITEGYSPREMLFFKEIQTLRLRLADLEDDILYRYSPDWFRCETCGDVHNEEHISSAYAKTDKLICDKCAPDND